MNSKVDLLIYPERGKRKNIFFSGKGGVGKTSMACITAVRTAKKGFKTLLMTTDPAAHIGNVLDKPVSDEITKIDSIDNLYAVKIDQKKATEDYKSSLLKSAEEKFDENTIKAMEEELNSPCTEEMAAFQKFIEHASGDDFDVIVFDTAPTGHTLRLLELPMDWSKQIQLKTGMSAEVSDADKEQKARFDKVIDMMKDKESTTFGFVMYPEKTPIVEAHRASKELETVGIKTQLVVANLIIPEEQAVTPFFKNSRAMQVKYLEEIGERFSDSVIIQIPMYDKEVKGLDMLTKVAEQVFKGGNRMSEKIKIEVFGIKDLQAAGGCSCSGGCGPVKTMGEAYDELVEFLSKVNIKDRIETRFIDMLEDNTDEYESIKNAVERGYTLPLTAINGTLKFYGGISNEMTYDEIKKLI